MRRAFAETLVELAEQDPRIVFLTGDLGFQVFDEFRRRFGPRYVNVGVAEAELVCAAAGLALEGWRPLVYSIASFATGRPFEQIRISIGYPALPVIVVGAGGGFCYASSGVTHHAPDDLALMSLLPSMTVVAPGDPHEVRQLLPQLFQLKGPSYLRIGKFGEPTCDSESPVVLGRARLLRDGEKVAIITTGDTAAVALDAARALEQEGMHPVVCQMHTVKPLDRDFLAALAEKVHTIIAVEEHVPLGGLGAAISAWVVERERAPKLLRLGPPDALALGNPSREELRARLHYDAQSLAAACRSAWQAPRAAR